MISSEILRSGFQSFLSSIRGHLNSLSHEKLVADFDNSGKPMSAEAGSWQSKWREKFKIVYHLLPDVFSACLGKPNLMADMDAWSKMSFFNLDEAVWLSVGLEPEKFKHLIAEKPRRTDPETPPLDFMRCRHEQFRRQFNPHGYEHSFDAQSILNWINRVNLEAHHGYRAMLEHMTSVQVPTMPSAVQIDPTAKPDKREVESVSVLLLAMAMDHYGYDPKATRSSVPKEIQDMMATLGLELSQDTILKYLRIGAKYLPTDWGPTP